MVLITGCSRARHHPLVALGRVVLLNGPTSSGKTAIARAFQRLSDDPWLRLGIDVFWAAIDERWMEFGPRAAEGFRWVETPDGDPTPPEVRIVSGPPGTVWLRGCERLSELWRAKETTYSWTTSSLGRPGSTIGRRCSPESKLSSSASAATSRSSRHASARRNRVLGEARGQVDVVHRNVRYDVEVDTSSASAEECDAIAQALTSAPRPRTLERHRGNGRPA